MAATGFTPVYIYASGTTGNIPSASNLTNTTNGSEIALNYFDGKLFYKNASNSVITVPLLQSSGSQNGWLSSTDWTTFNNKQAALVSGTNIKTVGGVSLLGSGDVGTIGVGYGGTGTSTAFTAGSVVFAGASGIYSQNNSNLFWDDTNKYLGIGTATPVSQLNVFSATATSIFLQGQAGTSIIAGRYSNDGSQPSFNLRKYRGTVASPTAVSSGDFVGTIPFQAFGGANIRNVALIGCAVDTYTSDTNISGFMYFSTNGGSTAQTERMRIHASGGVSINNTTDAGTGNLAVAGQVIGTTGCSVSTDFSTFTPSGLNAIPNYGLGYITSTSTPALSGFGGISFYTSQAERVRFFQSGGVSIGNTTDPGATNLCVSGTALFGSTSSPSSTNSAILINGPALYISAGNTTGPTSCAVFYNANGVVGQIYTSGTSTTYSTSSDRRLKSDISDVSNSGAFIDSLKPRSFTWNADGSKDEGFIADEYQQIIPSAVFGEPEGKDVDGNEIYQSIDCSTPQMIANIVAELQSLRKRVAQLEGK